MTQKTSKAWTGNKTGRNTRPQNADEATINNEKTCAQVGGDKQGTGANIHGRQQQLS